MILERKNNTAAKKSRKKAWIMGCKAQNGISRPDGAVDYSQYTMGIAEYILYSGIAAAVIYAVAFLFYRSHILSLLATPLCFFYPRIKAGELCRRRKDRLLMQFKDMLYSLASSISAGRSVESSFHEALKDLVLIYPDPACDIIRELKAITRKLEMNITLEAALADFADRSGLEDIQSFVDVFYTCKRTGGNISEVVRNASNIINDKLEIRQEIDTMLAERRMERKVLTLLPIGMLLILSMSAGDYMVPVFSTAAGRLAMTASVVLLAAAGLVSKKIMDIEV